MSESDMRRLSISDPHKPIHTPNDNDVLCGRGGNINSHPGNEHFRKMVEKHRRVYLNARFKEEKRLIATTIVSEIRALDPPGRFLTKDAATGTWLDIGDAKARDKTSQALRENAPSIRAGINGESKPKPKPKRKKKAAPATTTPPPVPVQSSYPPPPMQQPQQQQQWNGAYPAYYHPQQGTTVPLHQASGPPPVVSSHPPVVTSHPTPYGYPPSPQHPHAVQQQVHVQHQQQPHVQHPQQPHPQHQQQVHVQHQQQVHVQHQQQPHVQHQQQPHVQHQQQPHVQQHPQQAHVQHQQQPPAQHHQQQPLAPTSNMVWTTPTVTTSSAGGAEEHKVEYDSPPAQTDSVEIVLPPDEVGSAHVVPPSGGTHTQSSSSKLPYSPIQSKAEEYAPVKHRIESRNEESQVMEIEEDGNQSSSLLTMVASHILGAWDTDAVCGVGDEEIMPPPKSRKGAAGGGAYGVKKKSSFGSNFSDILSPDISMEVDVSSPVCPKEWQGMAAEMDATSLGSFSSGLMSMNDNVLNQVPSWEGSLMSTASTKHKDSVSVASSRVRQPEAESEASVDTFVSQDYVDTRLAMALQQQENVAAYEAFKKRYNASLKASTNRTARSSALDRIKIVRDKEGAQQRQHDNIELDVGGYIPPPDDSALPQEIADHRLAAELQRFEQARVGTVQQMERILKEEQNSEEVTGLRTGRSVYK